MEKVCSNKKKLSLNYNMADFKLKIHRQRPKTTKYIHYIYYKTLTTGIGLVKEEVHDRKSVSVARKSPIRFHGLVLEFY